VTRPQIPARVQIDKFIEQNGRCAICKKKMIAGEKRIIEHTPCRSILEKNGEPNPDDPKFLSIVCKPCADLKTRGKEGESDKHSVADGDTHRIAKAERIAAGGKTVHTPMRKHPTLKRTIDGRIVER
jgi:hypothetical protein